MSGRGVKRPAELQPPRRNPARVCRGPAGAAPGGPPAAATREAAGASAAAAGPLAAGPEAAAAAASEFDGDLLPPEFWARVARLASGRDAVMLSSTCRRLRPLFSLVLADGAFQPAEGPDGTLQPPASGRGCLEVGPDDNLQAAVDRCPEGGAIMLAPGTYVLPAKLRIDRGVHLCGGGRATLDGGLLGKYNTIIKSTAAHVSVDGLMLRGSGVGIYVTAGGLQVSACDICVEFACIVVNGVGARPAVIRNRLRGRMYGLQFFGSAGGRIEHNTVRDCSVFGIELSNMDPSLRVAHNSVEGCDFGICLCLHCPAAFALGPGNEARGNKRGDIMDRQLR